MFRSLEEEQELKYISPHLQYYFSDNSLIFMGTVSEDKQNKIQQIAISLCDFFRNYFHQCDVAKSITYPDAVVVKKINDESFRIAFTVLDPGIQDYKLLFQNIIQQIENAYFDFVQTGKCEKDFFSLAAKKNGANLINNILKSSALAAQEDNAEQSKQSQAPSKPKSHIHYWEIFPAWDQLHEGVRDKMKKHNMIIIYAQEQNIGSINNHVRNKLTFRPLCLNTKDIQPIHNYFLYVKVPTKETGDIEAFYTKVRREVCAHQMTKNLSAYQQYKMSDEAAQRILKVYQEIFSETPGKKRKDLDDDQDKKRTRQTVQYEQQRLFAQLFVSPSDLLARCTPSFYREDNGLLTIILAMNDDKHCQMLFDEINNLKLKNNYFANDLSFSVQKDVSNTNILITLYDQSYGLDDMTVAYNFVQNLKARLQNSATPSSYLYLPTISNSTA